MDFRFVSVRLIDFLNLSADLMWLCLSANPFRKLGQLAVEPRPIDFSHWISGSVSVRFIDFHNLSADPMPTPFPQVWQACGRTNSKTQRVLVLAHSMDHRCGVFMELCLRRPPRSVGKLLGLSPMRSTRVLSGTRFGLGRESSARSWRVTDSTKCRDVSLGV